MLKILLKIFLIFLLCVSCNGNSAYEISNGGNVISLFEQDFFKNLNRAQKIEFLEKAYQNALDKNNDSLKNKMLLEISYQYFELDDSLMFRRTNEEARNLSIALKDSSAIAATYWDLGLYYQSKQINDSAYYHYNKGYLIYEAIENDFGSARLLLNMAMVQKNIKDYTGSEITTTQAITLLKPLQKYKQLFSAYNNLGIIFNELEEYDRAIFYHKKALEYLEKTDQKRLKPMALNNIGVVYENQGLYKSAIINYESALKQDSLYQKNPGVYAMLLDNLAYAQFKNGINTDVTKLFFEALEIRDSLKDYNGISINKLHLAEYFLNKNDTLQALRFGDEARELSKGTNNYRDLLSSLLLLSKLDTKQTPRYLESYIRLNDSLQKEERSIRNKFARIRFETEEYISETERLNQRVVRISFIAIGLILISILLYIIKDQWSKNKFIKQKQDANQEIYNLILAQQKNFEEGREIEKQHISRELHDGILGKLLGVRLSLDILNEEDTPAVKKKRFEYIEEIQHIAEEIRFISHRLNKVSLIDVDYKTVLEELIEKQYRGKIKFRLDVNPCINWEGIEDNIKINIYRIVQEAISNIHKHSGATEAFVQIRKNENKLILEIFDNGKGISEMHSNTGIGLKNMKVRAKNIGGDLEITQENERTQGSLIKLTVKP